MRILFPVILPALLATTPCFAAEERAFIDTPEPVTPSSIEEGKPWEEIASKLPPWPRDSDLIEFELDSSSPFRYYIDRRHLGIGRDEVVRYTLVAESSSGARNVSFEGIRCKPRGVYRIYAYGSRGTFHPIPESDWIYVRNDPGDMLHRELHGHFLCGPRTFAPRPKKDMIRALKGHIAERENAGFVSD